MRLKIPGKAFGKLKKLGEEVLSEIDRRLLGGESGAAVAAWLQKDMALLVEDNPASLKKTLERYRETELRDKTLQRIAGAQTKDALRTIAARLNAMDELERLTRLQVARVEKLLAHETNLPGGIVNKGVKDEMRLAKDMVIDLGKLQLDTGILARAPKTVKGTVTTPDGEVRTFEWTEEQEELFKSLEGVDDFEEAR